jgi:Fe2+ transport system protein FeoA
MADVRHSLAALFMMRFFGKSYMADKAQYQGSIAGMLEGEEGLIETVNGNSVITTRLRELGVGPGVRVRLLRSGCPTVVQVEQGRFCVRRKDAATIKVRQQA